MTVAPRRRPYAAKVSAAPPTRRHRYERLGWIPFVACHFVWLGVFWSGIDWTSVVVFALLYWGRMFAVTAGYHRYFAHRSFQTSRVFQALLAFGATLSIERGPLWWAAHHRAHHLRSDTEADVHSPRQHGFLHAHVGWFFSGNAETDLRRVRDLAKYPELRWMDRHPFVAPTVVSLLILAAFGWPSFFFGWSLSSILVWHGTFTVNSLAHVWGTRRYETGDDSRNNVLLALLTCGEGWHNNHHRYMTSARMGHRWWEIDLTWYGLLALERLGLIWNLKPVPARILDEARSEAPAVAAPLRAPSS
ncbi:MAG: acyl-CoA desaturase [Sandaracinaceae bacterium]|nr:acyl-CoA desaturase [Sandaracinaceae bacterium]